MSNTCPSCGSSNPTDFDDSAGRLVCTNCGHVVNDSFIVSEISFGETSSGAARVQGSYVAEGQTHAGGGGGRFRSGNSLESREQIIQNGRRKIVELAGAVNCPEHFSDHAQRWFTLSVTHNFNRGRKTQFVVACCLYIVCRLEKSSHMLIDFSDILNASFPILQVNVFALGHTYLQLVQILEVRLPHIDPTVYVYRFAKHLDFGSEQTKVANDALRIIQRMSRDWMVQGRRPSGICGAALILAARMNNFRRSVREVVYVVKVADLTIQKRLDEFKDTKSGDLTVEEFRNIWLEQAHDPPSYGPKASKRRKRVRDVNDDGEVIEDPQDPHDITTVTAPAVPDDDAAAPTAPPSSILNAPATPAIFLDRPLRLDADGFVIPELPVPSPLPVSSLPGTPVDTADLPTSVPRNAAEKAQEDQHSAIAEEVIESEISSLLGGSAATIMEELREADRQARAASASSIISDDPDNLDDVDDDIEVQNALLTEEERDLKEKIWVEFNKDYLLKRLKKETDVRNGIIKTARKRKKNKPRDSNSEDMAATPADSAKNMLMRRSYSKKINYKAIEGLFEDD
ncbi:cyclin-like protein [Choiromyces venosus 120613-1]|uniref:B-related factor 1 n=1 Tax=Choiromyces venosus 120613-1 TaxID=1336337 RepID=A0A3N4J095_9PEZI|nr:cyclin-like protein [Choiromyces venosus 120613-1]RPB03007.1 cyclin-like protein [Choiromyces venosus 120613-1]